MEQKALALINPAEYAIVRAPNVGEIINEVLAPGETISFSSLPAIKIPAGGGTTWELPNGEATKELQCVILHRQPVRAYWSEEFSGGGAPPDCSSTDSVIGNGMFGVGSTPVFTADGGELHNPTGKCATCPMSRWGSGRENTQACRQITRLFLMFPESILPTVLSLPPSSFNAAKQYIVGLGAMGQSYWKVVTAVSLVRTKSGGGIDYSQAAFRKVGEIDDESAKRLTAFRDSIVPAITGAPVLSDEV